MALTAALPASPIENVASAVKSAKSVDKEAARRNSPSALLGPTGPRMFAFLQLNYPDAIDRRRFLALGAIMVAGAAASACQVSGEARAFGQPDLLTALGPDVVRRLGQRYRQTVPSESDAARLEAAIRASRPWTARIGIQHRPIAEQVRDDFDAGRTVIVDGWLLSVTEARQCALYSAIQG